MSCFLVTWCRRSSPCSGDGSQTRDFRSFPEHFRRTRCIWRDGRKRRQRRKIQTKKTRSVLKYCLGLISPQCPTIYRRHKTRHPGAELSRHESICIEEWKKRLPNMNGQRLSRQAWIGNHCRCPALLPLTSDFYPNRRTLDSDYLEYNYKLYIEEEEDFTEEKRNFDWGKQER